MHTGISQTQIGTNAFLKSRAAAAADEAQTASAAYPEVSEQGASLLDTVLQGDPASRPTATALVAFLGAAAVESAGDDDGRLREALAAKDAALVEKDAALTTALTTVAAKDASLVEKEVALTTALTTVAAKDASLAAKDAALAEKDASLDNKEAALAAADGAAARADAATRACSARYAEQQRGVQPHRARNRHHRVRGGLG